VLRRLGTTALAAAIAIGVVADGGAARADRLTETPELQPTVSLSHKIKTRLTELSTELGSHLSAISFDLLDMRFNAHEKRARVKVDAGSDDTLSLRVDGDVVFEHGAANVKARVDLGLAGRVFSFQLPEFDMVPRSFGGTSYVELRLPVLKGNF
jgi:hypothetical protein